MEEVWPKELRLLLLGIAAVVGLGLAAAILYPRYKTLELCDAAVQARLRAPETYVRVDPTIWTLEDEGTVYMSYDANNGFGVPVRGYGQCRLNSSRTGADWHDKLDLLPGQ